MKRFVVGLIFGLLLVGCSSASGSALYELDFEGSLLQVKFDDDAEFLGEVEYVNDMTYEELGVDSGDEYESVYAEEIEFENEFAETVDGYEYEHELEEDRIVVTSVVDYEQIDDEVYDLLPFPFKPQEGDEFTVKDFISQLKDYGFKEVK